VISTPFEQYTIQKNTISGYAGKCTITATSLHIKNLKVSILSRKGDASLPEILWAVQERQILHPCGAGPNSHKRFGPYFSYYGDQ
tara:strand:+ start:286 stop:540 length:255 start_codon:yes stop_codon:yes gene_type:complete